ncbi:PIN domain-containing protein [Deinococcus sp. AJ005]|uniref:PIN domain-containing protein n=1 Tax=Deinococcus sp. AJ005 TaxID=2652443 RepID=UPI00125CC08B|nr:PIN domain-containing protein [Deinococcus sp. AJ005]QFP77592.1 PIN domain-containing protein [Deinococcus sp. AJ005]
MTGEPSPERQMLAELVQHGRVQMLGCIRQEVLQGIKRQEVFERIRQTLRPFADWPTSALEYELAAEFFNICRSNGIQGSNTDFLICACSVTSGLPVLTKDRDFARYAAYIPVTLVQV